jgi:hypothetical protein
MAYIALIDCIPGSNGRVHHPRLNRVIDAYDEHPPLMTRFLPLSVRTDLGDAQLMQPSCAYLPALRRTRQVL